MAKLDILKGSTSQSVDVFIQDSSVTTGAGKTGLAFNTSSLVAYYHRMGSSPTAITLVTQTVNGAWSSGGFVELDATNYPGMYRLDIPDAVLATGVRAATIMLKGAANMAPCPIEIQLTNTDNQDGVRNGMTALPNVASGSAGAIPTTGTGSNQINVTGGRTDADVLRWNGTAVSSPATAGIPDVNVKNMNNVAATSITTINANQGTTQPTNFTGTGASALAKSDMVDVAGAAVSTSTAQLGVNAVQLGGTAQAGRDIGTSVLLSSGTGAGQLDFTSGVVKSNLVQLIATALTETSGGLIAAAFKKFFDKATPTGTINSIPDAVAGAAGGLVIAGSNAAITANITGNLTGNVSGSVGSVTGAVGSVTGNVGGNVTGSVGSVATGGIAAASFAAGAIDAAAIATDAIGSAELASSAITKIQAGLSTLTTSDIPSAATIAAAVWNYLSSAATTVGSLGKRIVDNLTGDIYARIGAPVGASISADIAAVQADTDDLQTRIPAALVSGRIDASVGAMAANTVTASAVATNAIDADALATDAVAEIADGLLNRDMSTGTDSGSTTVRTVRQAMYFLRNKWSISGTTLTVTKTDDSTASWTSTVTTSASADPITGSDPA